MIIVKLMGGLGNQLFQYALGRHLAEIHETELQLDLSFLNDNNPEFKHSKREYELHEFNIREIFANEDHVKTIKSRQQKSILNKTLRIVFSSASVFHYIRETGLGFNSNILNTPDNSYIDGFWQSYKYFENIRGILNKEFIVKTPLSGFNKEYADIIKTTNSVSMHVRRGDYITNKEAACFHGTCSPAYYHEAVNHAAEKIASPHFFVFSDDLKWAKESIKINYPIVFVENNTGKGFEDLRLMCLCKHHIIANSSFSWWGAWLSSFENKIVIAPHKWFNDPLIDTSDRIPSSWIRK